MLLQQQNVKKREGKEVSEDKMTIIFKRLDRLAIPKLECTAVY